MNVDLEALARAGATIRVNQIQEEITRIKRAFPDLSSEASGPESVTDASVPQKNKTEGDRTGRRRKRMTPAQRRAVSERMKRYWAGQRGTRGQR